LPEHPDPAFPALHGRPAAGWLNDPNGCAYVDQRYHVFFQALLGVRYLLGDLT
jgi:beta-fructofuranosidase